MSNSKHCKTVILLKDSSKSDRKLAKVLGVSQATVSRMEHRLVKDGLIQHFTICPDLVKLGYEIMAISTVKTKLAPEILERGIKWMNKFPNIIFAARCEGKGANGLMVSLHRDYTDYSDFRSQNLQYWGDVIEDYDSLLISLKGTIAKPLSFRYLAQET